MRLVVATGNQGKVREFKRILEPMGYVVLSLKDLELEVEVAETGATFAENARIKAETIMQLCGLPTIADDSGLCVDALGGAPGVHSARYAGEHATDSQRIEKLLAELAAVPEGQRGAHFACAICCIFPDGTEITAEGECRGSIAFAPQGDGGFGYDPVFLTQGGSFGQLSAQEKDQVSHRGKALRQFCQRMAPQPG